jgi:hypothetical protein
LNCLRTASWFAQFIIGASLVAQTPKPTPSNPAVDGDIDVVFQVTDLNGAAVARAKIVIKDAVGRATVQAQTDQDGQLYASKLRPGSYVFAVSTQFFQEFQGYFSVSPGKPMEITVVLQDRCHTDPNFNCDEITAAPAFVDVVQSDLAMVIEPYPVVQRTHAASGRLFQTAAVLVAPSQVRKRKACSSCGSSWKSSI